MKSGIWCQFFEPGGSDFYIYDQAITGISTGAYVEVQQILAAIQADHIDGKQNRYRHVLVVGDQQLYDRMNVLIRENAEQYNWVIPLPGEFHFMAHCYDTTNKLYWTGLTEWCVKAMDHDMIIKENDDNITKFKQYDRFYTLLTVSVFVLLCQTATLLHMCRQNQGPREAKEVTRSSEVKPKPLPGQHQVVVGGSALHFSCCQCDLSTRHC